MLQKNASWQNSAMRQEFYGLINWWLDKGIDGFRLDAIGALGKADGLPSVEPVDGTLKTPCPSRSINQRSTLT